MAAIARLGSMFALLLLTVMPSAAADAALVALSQPGTHALMRHADAPGTGDPSNFKLGDCATQRNLDEEGRAQARRIGERLRGFGVTFDLVLTSQWCRTTETAQLLGIAPVEPAPELNSFFAESEEKAARTAALRRRLAALNAAGSKAVLVTHQVNITALTGVFPASGEIVVISVDPAGSVVVEGRIRIP